jgi:hypothetical protein
MKDATKFLVVLIAIGCQSTFGQVSSEFSKATLVFDMTVNNPSSQTRHLVQVGVESHSDGDFNCSSASSALIPLADYPIKFHIKKPETIIAANPTLELPAHSSARFTISLYPNATGYCGLYWAADVRAIAIFDDGTRVYSQKEQIDADDLKRVRNHNPKRDALLGGLKHRDPALRIQSLQRLSSVKFDPDTVVTVLRTKFEDTDRNVRKQAYKTAAEMQVQVLIPDLVGRYSHIPQMASAEDFDAYAGEVGSLCESLGLLKAREGADVLIASLLNEKARYYFYASDALKVILDPSVPLKIVPVLESKSAWANEKLCDFADRTCPEHFERYRALLDVELSYRSMKTVSRLIKLAEQSGRVAEIVLLELQNATSAAELVNDPFILAFKALATEKTRDASTDTRSIAISLLARIGNSKEETAKALAAGLADSAKSVRERTAWEVSSLKARSLIPDLFSLYQLSSEADEKTGLCESLRELQAVEQKTICNPPPSGISRGSLIDLDAKGPADQCAKMSPSFFWHRFSPEDGVDYTFSVINTCTNQIACTLSVVSGQVPRDGQDDAEDREFHQFKSATHQIELGPKEEKTIKASLPWKAGDKLIPLLRHVLVCR